MGRCFGGIRRHTRTRQDSAASGRTSGRPATAKRRCCATSGTLHPRRDAGLTRQADAWRPSVRISQRRPDRDHSFPAARPGLGSPGRRLRRRAGPRPAQHPAAAAVPPDARPAPNTAPRPAKPPSAHVPAAVLAAKSRIRAPADQGPVTVSLTATRSDGLNPLHPKPGRAPGNGRHSTFLRMRRRLRRGLGALPELRSPVRPLLDVLRMVCRSCAGLALKSSR